MKWAMVREAFRGDPKNGKPQRTTQGLQFMAMVWLATTSALTIGLLTVGVESAAGSDFAVIGVETAGTAAAVNGQAGQADEVELPTGNYGGMIWSLADVRVVPRVAADPFSRPVIVIEALAANTTEAPLRVRESDLTLVWEGGDRYPAHRFEPASSATSFTVEPGEVSTVTAVFKPAKTKDPWLPATTLEVGEPGRAPLTFTLDGSPVEGNLPVEGLISSEPVAVEHPDDPNRTIVVAPDSSTIDLNAGPYRASVGKQLNVVEVSVQHSGEEGDEAHLDPEFWELEVGGERSNPVRVVRSGQPRVGEDEVTLLFVFVATDDPELELIAGAEAKEPARFPISLTADP